MRPCGMTIAHWRVGLLAVSGLVSSCNLGSDAPSLVITAPTFDWGQVLRGAPVTASFVVRNDGRQVLRIEKVVSPCSCAVVRHDKEIPPGGTGTLDVSIDTQSLEGVVDKEFRVVSNDPERRNQAFRVRGTSIAYYEMDPKRPRLEGFRGERVEERIHIRIGAGHRLALSLPAELPEGLHAALESAADGAGFELTVSGTIPHDDDVQTRPFELTATFADGVVLPMPVPLGAKAIERVVSKPKRTVIFSKSDTEALSGGLHEGPKKSIDLYVSRPEVAFDVVGVELTGESRALFKADCQPVDPGKRYRVEVQLTDRCPETLARSRLIVRVAEPELRELRFEVMAMFSP